MPEPVVGSTWNYSGDPATSVLDEVRFLVQDVDEELPLLGDGEISYLLGLWMPRYNSATYVAAIAASVIARKFATVVNTSGDGVSVSTADLHDRYVAISAELIREYTRAGEAEGSPDIANILFGETWDSSLEPLQFGIGLDDNVDAGRQNYGGQHYYVPPVDWVEGGLVE